MKLGILCPGQGTQNLTMLEMVKENEIAKNILNIASEVLEEDLFLLDESRDIFENSFAQPYICAVQIATYNAIKEFIPKASVFAGYSLGELSLYSCNGALSIRETIELAKKRAECMDNANVKKSSLLSCQNIKKEKVELICKESNTYISIINVDNHFIIGGEIDNLEKFKVLAEKEAGIIKALKVKLASHTPLLKTASDIFFETLKQRNFKNPEIPSISSIDTTFIYDKSQAIDTLSKQISQTIQWESSLETMLEYGCTVILELGPGKALSKMVQKLDENITVRSVSDFKSIDGVIKWINKMALE